MFSDPLERLVAERIALRVLEALPAPVRARVPKRPADDPRKPRKPAIDLTVPSPPWDIEEARREGFAAGLAHARKLAVEREIAEGTERGKKILWKRQMREREKASRGGIELRRGPPIKPIKGDPELAAKRKSNRENMRRKAALKKSILAKQYPVDTA